MPIQYTYNQDENIVYSYTLGEIGYDELKEYFENILDDKTIANGFWEIVNLEDTQNMTLTFKGCFALSAIVKRLSDKKDYQGALLFAPNKLTYSITKLLFTVLRKVLSQNFYVENNHEKFKELVYKHLHVNYEFL